LTEEAFEAGAVDFKKKPSGGAQALTTMINQLLTKIKIAATKDVKQLRKKSKDYTLPSNHLDRTTKSNKIVLGMGAYEVISERGKELKIFALGSCIGLALYCRKKSIVGLCHVALPNSKTDAVKAESVPGYFADTAITALLNKMIENGCNPKDIVAKIAGGSKTKVELGNYFAIGQKNTIAVKAALLKKNIKLAAEDIGGEISRTAHVTPGKFEYYLHHPVKGNWEI
jgi:chemotaxis protein CheD